MPKFIMTELVDVTKIETARFGAGTGAANFIDDKEVGKACKLVAESRYNLCAVGDEIEGFVEGVETQTQDNYSMVSVRRDGRKVVMFDGLQATPGTGTVTIGGYVVAGTMVAKGTALTDAAPQKVCLAATALGPHTWRVVSLGSAGTGAVGTLGLIERV
jgi:hypothetical protein